MRESPLPKEETDGQTKKVAKADETIDINSSAVT